MRVLCMEMGRSSRGFEVDGEGVEVDVGLFARLEVFEGECLVVDCILVKDGEEAGARLIGFLEEFADVGGGAVGLSGVEAGGTELGDELGDEGGCGSFGGNDEDVDGRGDFIGDEAAVLEYVGEHDIAHAEADGGEGWSAEHFDESVVASAACDGAFGTADFVDFEDGSGVVGESADDAEVVFTPVGDVEGVKLFVEGFEVVEILIGDGDLFLNVVPGGVGVDADAGDLVETLDGGFVEAEGLGLGVELFVFDFVASIEEVECAEHGVIGDAEAGENALDDIAV